MGSLSCCFFGWSNPPNPHGLLFLAVKWCDVKSETVCQLNHTGQAGLELTKACHCFKSTGINGVNLHTWFYVLIFAYKYIYTQQVEKSCMKARIYAISECPERDSCPTYICWMKEWIIQTTTHSVLFFFCSSVQAKNFQWAEETNH